MTYELFNDGDATPNRLHGLLRLVARRPNISAEELCGLLQPASLMANTHAAEVVLDAAYKLDLARGSTGKQGRVQLAVDQEAIEEIDAFRNTMSRCLLGITDVDGKNFVFNLFTAWYAAQDADVFRATAVDLSDEFNSTVFPGAQGQEMNSTKFPAWRTWATFLGYGWIVTRGSSRVLVPDCRKRITEFIDAWLPNDETRMPFATFIEHVGRDCPELDGGSLFGRTLQSGVANQERGQRVSLMLSTALRGLHDSGRCTLIRLADAQDVWHLFPASGHEVQDVTHISRGGDHGDA